MTDRPPGTNLDLHPDDETLSAFVDGEVRSPEIVGHIDACPVCQRRLRQFRAVASAVGRPVDVDPERRNATVELAVRELRPLGRPSRRVAVLQWSTAIAAAIALVVLLGPLLRSTGGDSDDSSAGDSAATGAESDATATEEEAADLSAGPAAGDVISFGVLSGPDDLVASARTALARQPARSTSAPAEQQTLAAVSCGDQVDARLGRPTMLLVGRATLDGQPVEVFVYVEDDGAEVHVLAVDASCREVVDQGFGR
jgi:hypothetical protein